MFLSCLDTRRVSEGLPVGASAPSVSTGTGLGFRLPLAGQLAVHQSGIISKVDGPGFCPLAGTLGTSVMGRGVITENMVFLLPALDCSFVSLLELVPCVLQHQLQLFADVFLSKTLPFL